MRAASLTRLVMAAVACSALALPASAAAQSARDRNGAGQQGWESRGSEAYQRGFREGERLGDEDVRRNRAFSAQSHREYRDAEAGYDRNDGSRDRYRDEYRRGFTEGYRIGYRKGVEDRRDNHRFEPQRFKEVRQGTAPGYDDEFGSRERYTFSYRDGFRLGYDDGFRSAYARR